MVIHGGKLGDSRIHKTTICMVYEVAHQVRAVRVAGMEARITDSWDPRGEPPDVCPAGNLEVGQRMCSTKFWRSICVGQAGVH